MKKLLKSLLSNFQIWNFIVAIAIVVIAFNFWNVNQSTKSDLPKPPEISTSNSSDSLTNPSPIELPEENLPSQNTATTPIGQINQTPSVNTLPPPPKNPTPIEQQLVNPEITSLPQTNRKSNFGHYSYQESPQEKLVKVTGKYPNRTEYLHEDAAKAFNAMKADAKAQGIELVLISGFRTVAKQDELFQKQTKKRGSKEAASKLSAPPGYSEHHTGYAVDIGDGKQPKLDLKFEFESTPAYKWLDKNAKTHGFELSFPRDNYQGVSFEPWHWRYIGSPEAKTIFLVSN